MNKDNIFVLFLSVVLLLMVVALRMEGLRSASRKEAVDCYRAATQRDRCLCLTRVAARNGEFDEHASFACEEAL